MTATLAILNEVLTYGAINSVEVIKVTSEEEGTKVQSHDPDKTLFIEGAFGTVPEFIGEFGLTNIKMLSGLIKLNQGDTAVFKANRRVVNEVEVLDQFEFKNKSSKAVFKLMDASHIPQQATIAAIAWDVTVADFSFFPEFQAFAGLYSEVDKQFGIKVENDELLFTFGDDASSTHSGALTVGQATGSLKSTLMFPVDKFSMLVKLAMGRENSKLMFTDKGLLGVEVEADYGTYKYYLRQSVR